MKSVWLTEYFPQHRLWRKQKNSPRSWRPCPLCCKDGQNTVLITVMIWRWITPISWKSNAVRSAQYPRSKRRHEGVLEKRKPTFTGK